VLLKRTLVGRGEGKISFRPSQRRERRDIEGIQRKKRKPKKGPRLKKRIKNAVQERQERKKGEASGRPGIGREQPSEERE